MRPSTPFRPTAAAPSWRRGLDGCPSFEWASLRSRTSMAVGGRAERLFEPRSPNELQLCLARLRESGSSPFILGGGFNTVFPDGPYPRPVIHTHRLRGCSIEGRRIHAEAGVRLEFLITAAIKQGLAGLEKFRGIPASVGGAIAMNAGGSGHEFGQLVHSVDAIDPESGELVRLPGSSIRWGYRRADLGGLVVAAAELELVPGDPLLLREEAAAFHRWKAAAQPLGSHNAGCIFRNPPGHSAGKLIDDAGLKGERVGSAVISCRHANFIVNENGKASTRDIVVLIEKVRARVEERFGVRLELELVLAD